MMPEGEPRRRPRAALPRTPGAALAALAAAATVVALGGALALFTQAATSLASSDQAAAIIGTPGPDVLRGGKAPDVIVGRARGDQLFGGPAFDRLRGGRGSDRLIGQGQGALMVGGPGRDQFNMRNGRQVQGAGRDVIRARDGRPDEINCGSGDDVAYVDRVEDGVYDCERVVVPEASRAAR